MPAPDKTKEGKKFTCKFTKHKTKPTKTSIFDIQTHDLHTQISQKHNQTKSRKELSNKSINTLPIQESIAFVLWQNQLLFCIFIMTMWSCFLSNVFCLRIDFLGCFSVVVWRCAQFWFELFLMKMKIDARWMSSNVYCIFSFLWLVLAYFVHVFVHVFAIISCKKCESFTYFCMFFVCCWYFLLH